MTQWDYTEVKCPLEARSHVIAKMGREGWILSALMPVAIQPKIALSVEQAQQAGLLLIFRREHIPVGSNSRPKIPEA